MEAGIRPALTTRFEDLPEHLLGQISTYLHWLDIVNLWFCGSSALCSNLANGGVAQLDLEISVTLCGFHWPAFLTYFPRLSRFCLNDVGYNPFSLVSGALLATLPSQIRNLSLRISGALVALNDLLAAAPEAFPMLEALSISVHGLERCESIKELCWPRTLKSLTFRGLYGLTFALNPSSLPPRLSYLDASFHGMQDDSFAPFPTALETLKLHLDIFADILPLLPAGLTILKFSAGTDSTLPKPLDFPQLAHWQASGFFVPLPPSLTTLSLPIDHYPAHLLAQLPRSITEIDHWEKHISTNDLLLLPPRLRIATGLLPSPITKSMAMLLPDTLTEANCSVEPDALPYLKHLRYAEYLADSNHDLMIELKSMKLHTIPGELQAISLATIENFPFEAFPTSLTRLYVNDIGTTSGRLKCLPRTLKELVISQGYLSRSLSDWKLLPNLECLSLGQCPSLTVECSSYLPRTLATLRIASTDGVIVPLDWFRGLPQNLTLLDMSLELPDFDSYCLHLPRSLNRLSLNIHNPKGDLLRKMLKVSFPRDFSSLRLACLQSDVSRYAPYVRLNSEDVQLFFTQYRRLKELQLVNCSNFSPSELLQHLPPTCITLSTS